MSAAKASCLLHADTGRQRADLSEQQRAVLIQVNGGKRWTLLSFLLR